MPKIKVCGITNADDAKLAVDLGVDALGMVCFANAPRQIDHATVTKILAVIPESVIKVMLFVNSPFDIVQSYTKLDETAWLQFHGEEEPNDCLIYGQPYIKSLKPNSTQDIRDTINKYSTAKAIILDGGGGTGTKFEWSLVPKKENRDKEIFLAGGLTIDNVATAIEATEPEWVDVSSGVCLDNDPLRKDENKLKEFIKIVSNYNE